MTTARRVLAALSLVAVSAAVGACKVRTDQVAQSDVKTVGVGDYMNKSFFIKSTGSTWNPFASKDTAPYDIYECPKNATFESCAATVAPRSISTATFLSQLKFFVQARRRTGGYQPLEVTELAMIAEIGKRFHDLTLKADVMMYDEQSFSKAMAPYGKEVLEALQLGFLDEYTYKDNFLPMKWRGDDCDTSGQSKDGKLVTVNSWCMAHGGAITKHCRLHWDESDGALEVDYTGFQRSHPTLKNFERRIVWLDGKAAGTAAIEELVTKFAELATTYCDAEYAAIKDRWTAVEDFLHPNLKGGFCKLSESGDGTNLARRSQGLTCDTTGIRQQCEAAVFFNADQTFHFGHVKRRDYETDANGIRIQKIVVDEEWSPNANATKIPEFWNNAYAEIARVCPDLTK